MPVINSLSIPTLTAVSYTGCLQRIDILMTFLPYLVA
jgi:hypothetical protein